MTQRSARCHVLLVCLFAYGLVPAWTSGDMEPVMSSSERELGSIECSLDLTGEYTSEYNAPVQITQTNCSLFVDPPGREVGLVLGDRISIENVKGKLVGDNIQFDNQAVWTKDTSNTSKKHSLDKEQVMGGLSQQVVEAVKHPNQKHLSAGADEKARPFWETFGIGLAISSSATAIGGLAAGIAAHEAQVAYQQKRAAAKVQVVEVQVAVESNPAPSSSLADSVQAGAKTLPVASQAGFAVGASVVIDQGTSVEEVVEVVGFGSLVLKHATKYPHGAGASITLLPVMASKSVGASAEAKTAAAAVHSSWEGTSSHLLIGVALSLSVLTVIGGAFAFCHSRPKKMTSLGDALSTSRELSLPQSDEYSGYGEEDDEQEESEEEAQSLVKPWTVDQGLDIWSSSHSRLAITPYILDPPAIGFTVIPPITRLPSREMLPSGEEP